MAEHFEAAAEAAKAISDLSDANKLKIYGMYKQATLGDNTTDKPGMFNMVGKAKWQAWTDNKGAADAKGAYVALVKELKPDFNPAA